MAYNVCESMTNYA